MCAVKKIHHVAIVVDSIDDSMAIWDALGLKVKQVKDVPDQESRVAFVSLGDAEI